MLLKYFFPSHILLGDIVSSIGIVHFTFSNSAEIPPKTFCPRPGQSLCFFPRDPEYVRYAGENRRNKRPSVYLMGQHTVLTERFVGHDFLGVFVNFHPGGVFRLTGIPAHELTNICVDAELIFSKDIMVVNDQLSEATSYGRMVDLLERYLLNLVQKSGTNIHRVDLAASLLLRRRGELKIRHLASEACLSWKQFERVFSERIGVSAMLFSKIARFDLAFRLKNQHPEKDWLTIAIESGYNDYQHLARDFKTLTGYTPPNVFQREENSPERMLNMKEFSTP